eukprot:TRINITY_DN12146_c0_g2_i9.p1 TRINITY_DN12146_c0_g2~~TRINITY_DN12146_c0_g2_i9.p1  ORF type:complete len:510 (+),score=126.75 TRINITY_DN12146_c0_g2_i9:83-1612(+)
MRVWIFLFFISTCIPAISLYGHRKIPVAAAILEAEVESTGVWSMKSIFGQSMSNRISSYMLEENTPCLVQNPHLALKNSHTYEESSEVHDFSIVDDTVYYVTGTSVYSLNIFDLARGKAQRGTTVLRFTEGSYTYLHALKLPNSDVIIFLKGTEPFLSYIIVTKDNETRPIETTYEMFAKFTEEMRMVIYDNYVFIPAGTNGIVLYRYNPAAHILTYVHSFNNMQDARDLAIKPLKDKSELLIVVADYEEGLVTFTVSGEELNAGARTVTKEFVKAKSVSMVPRGEDETLLIIMDALGGASKYVVLSLNVESMKMQYEQIRLLDGVVHYGDITDEYASIIMDNSVMVLKILQEEDAMVGYINSQGVSNAKLFKSGQESNWVVHSRKNEIIVADLIASSGFLICRTGVKARSYNFTIYGHSKNCRLEDQTILNCYYTAAVVVNVVNKESLNTIILTAIIVAVAILIIVAFIVLITVNHYRKYKRIKGEIDKQEKLKLTRDSGGVANMMLT